MIGQLLDRRYQVIRVLAAGGFGETYIAQDTRRPGNPICVVKHLKPALNDPGVFETAKRLFNSEAESLERLGNYDQIPRLLAYFDENQEFFLVQEYIEGHTLSTELLPGQRWTENQVIQLLQEVLDILEFVHSQGVIHRDIKPDNIIRRASDNKLVLVDFGAVKQLRSPMLTSAGQPTATVAIGTPGYMPTEQGHGKPRPNSDIYSLGIIAIQAVTGLAPTQLPEDPNTGEILWQHIAPVSPNLANVLTKMVRYHFKDRYQTATEALQALQAPTARGYPTSVQQTLFVSPRLSAPERVQQSREPRRAGSFDPLPLVVGVLLTAAAGAIAAVGIGYLNSNNIASNNTAQNCLAVVVPGSNIRSEPSSANPDNVIETVSNETKLAVTGKRTARGWVEVKVDGQPKAWAHSDVISNGDKLNSCLQAKGTPFQTVDDSTLIAARPVPSPKPTTDSNPQSKPEASSSPAKVDNSPPKTDKSKDTPTTQDSGKSVVEAANKKYQSGDLQGAVALLQKSIEAGNATLKDAQDLLNTIQQWQRDWATAQATFNQINKAVEEGRWNDVLAYKVKLPLPNIQYWQDRAQALFDEAAKKAAEQNKTKQKPQSQGSKKDKLSTFLNNNLLFTAQINLADGKH